MKTLAALILLAVSLFGCAQTGQLPTSAPDPSGSPEVTASRSLEASDAGPTVSPTGTPAPAPSQSPGSGVAFRIGDWVVTEAERLNLRVRAGPDTESQGGLPRGSAGVIAGGPEEKDGYTWYAIATPGPPWETGCGTDPDPTLVCQAWFGWVAAGDLDGTPWLRRTEPPCPAAPTTANEFASAEPGLVYACFRHETLTLRAHVGPPTPECIVPYSVTPAWLHLCNRVPLQTSAAGDPNESWLMAALHPSLGECEFGGRTPSSCPFAALMGQDVELTGHFDDPAADDCVGHGVPNLDPVRIVYECRMTWVITAADSR